MRCLTKLSILNQRHKRNRATTYWLDKAHELYGVSCLHERQPVQSEETPVFIGIDYHKAYSVYSVLDAQGDESNQNGG
jgi:hypothetical protein